MEEGGEGARWRDTLSDGLARSQHLRHPLQTAFIFPADPHLRTTQ